MNKKNSLYIKAANGIKTERPPIWMMRQAGRYLPEYQAIRKKHSFLEMLKSPDLATEVTLQPIQRFEMDAAIMFSDILVTAQALGSRLDYIEKKGPVFENPIRTKNDIGNCIIKPTTETLPYILEEIKQLKSELGHTPLIGFAGAPFTVGAYMIEGHLTPQLSILKKIRYTSPEIIHSLLDKLTTVTIDYINEQIKAGIDALQIFDTWAGILTHEDCSTFSLNYIEKIIKSIKNPNNIPITLFCKGTTGIAERMINLQPNVIALDWQTDLDWALNTIPKNIAMQGNLDPLALQGTPEILLQQVSKILEKMKHRKGFIFNLGHGVLPQTDPENVRQVVEYIKSFKNDH
tara:strand:- start:196 stop:1236 length:1041 start_codon:yes stop_codon:yes gene_type:complete